VRPTRRLAAVWLLVGPVVVSACGSGNQASSATTSVTGQGVTNVSALCATGLLPEYKYIVRAWLGPGVYPRAFEATTENILQCPDQGPEGGPTPIPGECTQWALAASNPGYNVNAYPAPPLNDVVAQVGSGCP
jgi:hypothetical protein